MNRLHHQQDNKIKDLTLRADKTNLDIGHFRELEQDLEIFD